MAVVKDYYPRQRYTGHVYELSLVTEFGEISKIYEANV
jgi:hypothetical protein